MIASPAEGDWSPIGVCVAAAVTVAYAFVGKRLDRSFVTGPIIFFAVGMLLGPWGINLIAGSDNMDAIIYRLAEVALALALFCDASRIDFRRINLTGPITLRLLLVALPLTIIMGAGLAAVLLSGGVVALLVAALHAPTDQTFSPSVVRGWRIPPAVSQPLNVESAISGGLVLPIVLLAVGLVSVSTSAGENQLVPRIVEIVIGVAIGAAIGLIGAKGLLYIHKETDPTPIAWRVVLILFALGSYYATELLWGSGFLSAFVSGCIFGTLAPPQWERRHAFIQREGTLVALALFLFVGALYVVPALRYVGFRGILYAGLFLIVVRTIAVAMASIRTGLSLETIGYTAWFGPRGIATLVLGLWVTRELGAETTWIFYQCCVTVFLSAIMHGITAYPSSVAFAKYIHRVPNKETAPEHGKAVVFPARGDYE